jgi:hypothetical protein
MRLFAAGCVLITSVATAQSASDASRVLGEMRQALGGDAAIAAVKSFSVEGSESHSVGGHNAGGGVEFLCVLPDRFLHVTRLDSPFGTTVNELGFNGNERIRRRDASIPYPPDPGEHDTPAQKAQREARALANTRRELARMTIAMIGISGVDPVDVSYGGQQVWEKKSVDVLTLRAADGYESTVFVDATTHLPAAVRWMGTPIVTATASSIVAVPRGQSPGTATPPSFPAMPDPSSLPPVEHQLVFDDYKTADGLTWAHKFVETVGGREYSTIKLGKFKLNPNIDPKRFDPRVR